MWITADTWTGLDPAELGDAQIEPYIRLLQAVVLQAAADAAGGDAAALAWLTGPGLELLELAVGEAGPDRPRLARLVLGLVRRAAADGGSSRLRRRSPKGLLREAGC